MACEYGNIAAPDFLHIVTAHRCCKVSDACDRILHIMSIVSFEDAAKYYGEGVAVQNISFSIDDGEFVTLVGHSGSGKSTLFKLILGEEDVYSGSVAAELIFLP